MFKLKKCPRCNSTRITTNRGKTRCKKCGYVHLAKIDPQIKDFYVTKKW